jgi:uncharacterized membrane protein YidH (DUF202 family)
MQDKLIGGIVLIIFSIILLTQPWQLFVRNGSEMVNQIKTKPKFIKSMKVIGYIFLVLGIVIECSIYL